MPLKRLIVVLTVALPTVPAAAENFNAAQPPQPKLQVAKIKSFDFGKIYVHTDERQELFRVANLWRQRRAWWTITVEGNGYVAGDEEASIALGEKRAQRVRDLLVQYGVDPRFVTAIGNSREAPGRYVDITVDTCERCRR